MEKRVKRAGEYLYTQQNEMRGGNGTVTFEHLLEGEKGEFQGKGRLFSVTTLPPGASIGYHVHEGDMEFFYFLEGEAKYNDNGTETTVRKGDFTITYDGEGHSLENCTDKDVKFVAVILFS